MNTIKFLVKNRPKPQQRHRNRGKFQYDPSVKDKKDFILLVNDFIPKTPTKKNVVIEFTFCYKRPRSHFKSKNKKLILKNDAPFYKNSKADIDNLCKFYLDAMNGKFYKDDSQVVKIIAEKIWGYEDYILIKLMHNKNIAK